MSRDALLRALLRLYPAEFRAAFGEEMREVFAHRREEIRRRRGAAGLLALWVRTLAGVARAALLERIDAHRPAARQRRLKDDHTLLPRKRSNAMDRLLQDLRYSCRSLLRSPGFTAVAVLTLGIGIGVNTVVFSLVNALLLRPLPQVQEPSRLVVMFTGGQFDRAPGVSSYMDYRDIAARSRTLAAFAAFKPRAMDLTDESSTERIEGMMVSASYFDVLGVQPQLGRFFTPAEDDEPGAETVVVLSHDLWQTAFGGDSGVAGDVVRLNGLPFTVIGVTPPGFRGTSLESRPQLFVPMMMQPHFMPSSGNLLDSRGWSGIYTVGRLAEGVSLQQARDELAGIGAWLRETYPRFTDGREYSLEALPQGTLEPSDRAVVVRFSNLLGAVVGAVLLVACVNVANLMLSRALPRRHEIAVRQALGADRRRLVRQLLIESLTLAAVGGAVGLAMAYVARGLLERLPFPFALDFGFDARVLGFAAAVVVLTGISFGVVPALAATRVDLASPMRRAPERASGRRFSFAGSLVVAQVALSLVLLVAAGLFVRTLVELSTTELGFDADGVLVAGIDPSLQGYEGAEVRAFYRRLVERVEALPAVESVSLTSVLPAGGGDALSFRVQGLEGPQDGQVANVTVVGAGFFETMGIPLLRGRGFTRADGADAEPVLVVNQAGAQRLAGMTGGDPMDARLSFDGPNGPFARIVGIAADSKNSSLREEPQPMVYLAAEQQEDSWYALALLARTRGVPPERVAPALRAALHEVDPNVPAFRIGTLAEHLAETLLQERLLAGLVGFAALLALLLATVGLYGVLSYGVTRRTRELGIRRALGAHTAGVRYLVVRQALVLVALGGALGLAAALAGASLLAGFLYGVSPTDPLTYVVVLGLLAAVALLASYVPARRATRVDPLSAMRAD